MSHSVLIFVFFSIAMAAAMRFLLLTYRPVVYDLIAAFREAVREYRRRRLVRLKRDALPDPFTTN